MHSTIRMGRRRLVLLLLWAGIFAAAIPLAASTLAIGWERGFVKRVPMPNYNRVRLPERREGPANPDMAGEVAQAIAESVSETSANPVPPKSQSAQAAGTVTAPSAFIPVEFDILTPGAGGDAVGGEAIVVRKVVRLGQKDIGSLPIHVDGGSRLLVDASEVRSLLDDAKVPGTVRGSGLVSLADLRKSGIDLRYDPTSDSVVLGSR